MNSQEEWTEYQGYWWLPEFPDHTVAGTLTGIKTGDLELSLLGHFEEGFMNLVAKSVTYPTVLGIVSGKTISLSTCHVIGSKFSFSGFETIKLSVNTAFIGKHILNTEDAKFSKIILKFDYFDEWLCIPSIETKHIDDESGRGYDFSYRTRDPIELKLEEFNLSINFDCEPIAMFSKNIELKQFGFITLHNHEGMTLDEWNHKFINPWQDFLTLATGEPSHLQSLVILEGKDKIDVLFNKIPNKTPKEVRDWDMLFTFPDIYDNFGEFIKSWLSVSEKFDSVCNLFFSTKYTSSLYLENHFLPIVQALESYHRRSERFSNNIVEDQEYEIIKETLINSLSDNHKSLFQDKFQYLNEVGLRKRLKDIFEVTEAIKPLVQKKKDFINSVYNTRNYFTHFDQKSEAQVLHGRDLFWATRILGYMLQACLLREIGFSDEEVVRLIQRPSQFANAQRYIQEHYFKKDNQVQINHAPKDESDPLVGMFALSPTASISTEPFSAEELLKLEGKL